MMDSWVLMTSFKSEFVRALLRLANTLLYFFPVCTRFFFNVHLYLLVCLHSQPECAFVDVPICFSLRRRLAASVVCVNARTKREDLSVSSSPPFLVASSEHGLLLFRFWSLDRLESRPNPVAARCSRVTEEQSNPVFALRQRLLYFRIFQTRSQFNTTIASG